MVQYAKLGSIFTGRKRNRTDCTAGEMLQTTCLQNFKSLPPPPKWDRKWINLIKSHRSLPRRCPLAALDLVRAGGSLSAAGAGTREGATGVAGVVGGGRRLAALVAVTGPEDRLRVVALGRRQWWQRGSGSGCHSGSL